MVEATRRGVIGEQRVHQEARLDGNQNQPQVIEDLSEAEETQPNLVPNLVPYGRSDDEESLLQHMKRIGRTRQLVLIRRQLVLKGLVISSNQSQKKLNLMKEMKSRNWERRKMRVMLRKSSKLKQ